MGEKLFYIGDLALDEDDAFIVHGQQGEVIGPSVGALAGKALVMLFPGMHGGAQVAPRGAVRAPVPVRALRG